MEKVLDIDDADVSQRTFVSEVELDEMSMNGFPGYLCHKEQLTQVKVIN